VTEPVLGELSRLAAAILSGTDGAPPGELGELLGEGRTARSSLVPDGPTGLGTSSLRLAPRPSQTLPPDDDDDDGVPALFCPGPLRDDPALAAEVNEGVVAWAGEVGIYTDALDELRGYDFGRLITLAHPGCADPDRLLAATKCVVAEWAADDYIVDEVDLGADPMVVGSRLANLLVVVDPARLPAAYAPGLDRYRAEEPIATAFRSAMQHLARYVSPTQLGRFQHQMAILFLAWCQEADWHVNDRTPPVWEYLVQRHLNSYLPPMILVDPLAGYELTATEFSFPAVRRTFTTAGLANVLLNDIYSGAQESETDFNLLRVLSLEEGLTPHEALVRTVEIHNELMHAFVDDALALSATGSPQLRRFLADTWAWMGGSREWHATTARYHAAPIDAADPDRGADPA
jgi:2-methylisoborneol synthase